MRFHLNIDDILKNYQDSFCKKEYSVENNDSDILMDIFGISPELKRENRQYWGRELGKCWESIVKSLCSTQANYKSALRIGKDEPCDLILGKYAIDTKYRIGSGDSGTLKKFKAYGPMLKKKGFKPVLLFLREDNLSSAITACRAGGWELHFGDDSFEFLKKITKLDVKQQLLKRAEAFPVTRQS